MPARQFCTPHMFSGGKAAMLQRIPFDEKKFDESWFQRLLLENPSLLPVDEIEPLFGPLVPLAREMPTSAGPVDVVYINAEGYLTLVETKLWRNPEARRQVVAQIIDYATAISKWSYEDLCNAVRKAGAAGDDPVAAAVADDAEFDRTRFVDTVSRSLSRGRFLLLIVGDGIQEGVEHLADTLAKSPHLGFSLALVELAMFRAGPTGEDVLIQPRTIARTREVVRAVVELKVGVSPADVTITLPPTDEDEGGEGRRKITEEALLEEIAETTTKALADAFREFLRKAEAIGIEPLCRDSSISLLWREPNTEYRFTLGFVRANGAKVDMGFVRHYFRKCGLEESAGRKYIKAVADLVPGARVEERAGAKGFAFSKVLIRDREITLADLLPKSADWLAAIQTAMQETEAAGAAKAADI